MKREVGFYWCKVKTLHEPCIAKWNGYLWEIPGFFSQVDEKGMEWVNEKQLFRP